MDEILDQQRLLFMDFAKKYGCLIRNLVAKQQSNHHINDDSNLNLISLLGKFNRDFQVTIDELDTLNSYFDLSTSSTVAAEIQQKIKDYESMNATIKQFMPYIILSNITKPDENSRC